MEGLKEGLIGICLFMIGGHFVLFLQSGKRYQKITKIVLELSGICLFVVLVFGNLGERRIEEYWNRLEQTLEKIQGDELNEKSMNISEIEKDSDAFQELLMDSVENKLVQEVKSKINNSKIGEEYTVNQVFLEDGILNVALVSKENSGNMNETENTMPVEKVSIEVNITCQNQDSISDKEKCQLKEEIAEVLEMEQRNLEVILQ